MSRTNFDTLLEAGCHFGHLKRKWNPAMAPYIFKKIQLRSFSVALLFDFKRFVVVPYSLFPVALYRLHRPALPGPDRRGGSRGRRRSAGQGDRHRPRCPAAAGRRRDGGGCLGVAGAARTIRSGYFAGSVRSVYRQWR